MRAIVAIVALILCVAFASALRVKPDWGSTGPYNPGPYKPSPTFPYPRDVYMADIARPVRPYPIKPLIARAVEDLENALEEWRVYGNAGNGGRWEAGFEYKSKSDAEVEADLSIVRQETGAKVVAALENLEALLEEWRVYGNAGNGGRWEAGFEYKSKSDEEEEYNPEDWSVNGRASNNGWNVGGSVSHGGFTGNANVGNGGQWSAGGSYSQGPWSAGGSVSNGGNWNANVGYNKGGFSAGANVGQGGNWGVGASYKVRF